ncbi:unnamed protein product [Spodoptera littoralis]|uniref:Serpin domain-containing protein n=1 Tax=Spodoptera littoralis TaxID=7109 RepID=A0A9P0N8X2_SPOLI|nr:unnamed protein product [Spodoptera littoralis]CAH1646734.1 unnamed protein product [Spodoptera littoralis]
MDKSFLFLIITTLCFQYSGQNAVDSKVLSTIIPTTNVENDNLRTTNMKDNSIPKAINNFGYNLLVKMMNERKNENIVISPIGVAGLLAMTLLGSVGMTHDEIAETIGFSQDILLNRRNHEYFGGLLQSLNMNDLSKTLYADAIFVDNHVQLRELYRSYLHGVYGGDVLRTDFQETEESKNSINEWVSKHTEGNIDEFLKDSLPPHTKVVLLTALYFSGRWKQPFAPQFTRKMGFKRATDEVMADMMLNFGEFRYKVSEEYDFHMIALPYNDSETFMYALKPISHNKLTLSELMANITNKVIDDTINEMDVKNCVIRFPKMKIKSTTKLESTLQSIGIQSMFVPGKANFALMVNGTNEFVNETEGQTDRYTDNGNSSILDSLPNPGIHVDSIIHDVKLTINEFGTEAVAATSGTLTRSAESFYADSPFYIFIRNERTKLVTFSAVIFDPTE